MTEKQQITNEVIVEYRNGMGSTKITKVANAFVVAFMPVHGESETYITKSRKKAEIEFSYGKHILMRGEGI